MAKTPKKAYERIYIHAAKTRTEKEGWILILLAMDGYSQFAFEAVLDKKPLITIEALNNLFENILKDYNPIVHTKQIVFITSLSVECDHLIKQSIIGHHKFIYNKEATLKAMEELLESMNFKMLDL